MTYPKITILLCCSIFRKSVRSSSYPWTRSWKLNFCLKPPRTCPGQLEICSGWGSFLNSCCLCTCSALAAFFGEQIKARISKLLRSLSCWAAVPAQEEGWAAGQSGAWCLQTQNTAVRANFRVSLVLTLALCSSKLFVSHKHSQPYPWITVGMLMWPFSKIVFIEASEIMRDIGTAIQYLHSMNIAHRDVKVRLQGVWAGE